MTGLGLPENRGPQALIISFPRGPVDDGQLPDPRALIRFCPPTLTGYGSIRPNRSATGDVSHDLYTGEPVFAHRFPKKFFTSLLGDVLPCFPMFSHVPSVCSFTRCSCCAGRSFFTTLCAITSTNTSTHDSLDLGTVKYLEASASLKIHHSLDRLKWRRSGSTGAGNHGCACQVFALEDVCEDGPLNRAGLF